MFGEQFACLANRLSERVGEIFCLEMLSHRLDQLLPKLVAASLVDSAIADHRKLLCARCDEDEDTISLPRRGHAEFLELFPRRDHCVIELAALDENANLAGSFLLRLRDRPNDAIVLKFFEKIFRAHLTNLSRHRRRQSFLHLH